MEEKSFKIYGVEGHSQRESFNPSERFDFTNGEDVRVIEVLNSDVTGTNEYSIIKITRNTEEEVQQELDGQLSDGIFENSRYGKVEEVSYEEQQILNAIEEYAEKNDDVLNSIENGFEVFSYPYIYILKDKDEEIKDIDVYCFDERCIPEWYEVIEELDPKYDDCSLEGIKNKLEIKVLDEKIKKNKKISIKDKIKEKQEIINKNKLEKSSENNKKFQI